MAAVIGRQRGKHLFVIQMSLRRNMVLVRHARTDPVSYTHLTLPTIYSV